VAGGDLFSARLLDCADCIAARFHLATGLTAANIATQECESLIVALVCTGIFALYERRRLDSYGLPAARAFGARTWEGALVGMGMASAVAVGMYLFGGMQVHGFAGPPQRLKYESQEGS
jgi:hypothetical protein